MIRRVPTPFFIVATVVLSMSGGMRDEAAAQVASRVIPTLEWDSTLKNFNFDSDKFIGQRFTATCPPRSVRDEDEVVHGTDVYPSKDAICVAAVHAGTIDREGGTVTIQLNPGESSYTGSSRHGVDTKNLPGTPRSMVFLGATDVAAADGVRQEYIPRLEWKTKFSSTTFARKMFTGQRFAFTCPAAPGSVRPIGVFGTDSYAFHSIVCLAAVHAGRITTDGGMVLVQVDPGMDKLVGSIRNGIESKDLPGRHHHTISFTDDRP